MIWRHYITAVTARASVTWHVYHEYDSTMIALGAFMALHIIVVAFKTLGEAAANMKLSAMRTLQV